VLAVAAGLSGRGEPYVERLRQGGVTILSAAASDHETWNAWPQTAPRGYREFLAAYRKQRFDDAGLPDGYALKHADAVTVAVKAIRSAGTATGTVVPKLADVFEQAGRLNGVNAVPAYSGRLEFVSGGNGWPGGRPVPVLRTPPEPRPAAGTTREYLTTAG
jgi:hypothetical protein